jgi:uncharacterized glyoxalase superfamily protein PhnB
MNDDFDALRRLRPDIEGSEAPAGPGVFRRHKEQLMSSIGGGGPPPGEHRDPAMYPRLAYLDEVAALEYLTRVFGFGERREARMGEGTADDPMLAWLDFGDGVVMIGRADEPCHRIHHLYSPKEVGRTTAMINVRVDNIDEHYARAVAEGALITMSLEDAFYGFRRYEADDPEGNHWHFHESLDHVHARGGQVDE